MVKTTFKNVGQGDTIIVEWENEGLHRLGIIDCKLDDKGNNPVVRHLESLTTYRIEFIFLTHPHKDHCAGIIALFQYLDENSIPIEFFAFSFNVHKDYFNKGATAGEKLTRKIYQELKKLMDKRLIRDAGFLGTKVGFKLSKDLYLECLAPSQAEINYYQDHIDYFGPNASTQANQNANWLSSIIKLESPDWAILFTADAEEYTFARLTTDFPTLFTGKKFVVCQVPHHGSFYNFHLPFWQNLQQDERCVATISVGKNSHGHPSLDVLKSLETEGYVVKCTNVVNDAVLYYAGLSAEAVTIIEALDGDSELSLTEYPSDIVFDFT